MSSRHHIDDFIGKIEEGRKITDVAREFDIAHSVVSRLWKSFKTTGMCRRRHGGGRVRSTTPAEGRYVVLSAKRNRRTTAQQVANQFLAASGKQISRKSIARRLRGGGLYARRPVVCAPLTRQHRTARLQWCREHHNWTEQDWACVLFSDESRFSLSSDCRRQLIWHESGTAYRPENIQEEDRYPTCSITVSAGIMINGRTRLHVVVNGTMTDLKPIENVWDALGRQVAGRNYPPTNKNTLIRALTEEWYKLPQQLLDNFVQSMIPAQLACAYLKGHLKGRALDWFEVLGYRVIEDKTTDYAHLKQALSEQFPVIRNRSELETRFYSSSQRRDQQPSDFIYELLKIHKVLKLEMSEEKLIDHVVSRLEPQILDYVEIHPRNTVNLLQIVDKYEERFMHRQIRGSNEGFRSSGPHEGNRFNTRHRQENWRENRNNERYANNSRTQREYNRFENQRFANNRRFEGRRQGGQSDQPFHSQGGRQSGSRNSSFRGQNERSRNLNF
ncbi:transposable element Tcb1 transposase [Trichonephila clavipes]|nr:transposable element Tcb1 transposase [Trichonephila clavipes]